MGHPLRRDLRGLSGVRRLAVSRRGLSPERERQIEAVSEANTDATQALGALIIALARSRNLDAPGIHEAIMEWNPPLQAMVMALASAYVDLAKWQIMDEPIEMRPDPTLHIH